MMVHTDYLWFRNETAPGVRAHHRRRGGHRQEERRARRHGAGVRDAHHAAVYVNDWEDGLISDFKVWLEKLAPAGLPYRHHQTGEDNADAHLKRTLMGHQIIVPITAGKLDLGPWEQVFYAEFDGQRRKRVVVKVMGESD
jgi:secondary thiamine-phosphate synthase enzyme